MLTTPTKRPFEALDDVVSAGPPAGSALMQWLLTHREIPRVPASVRDDATQAVACKLLGRARAIRSSVHRANPGLGPEALDQKFTAYVGAMLRNQARDLLRARGRSCQGRGEGDRTSLVDLESRVELHRTLGIVELAAQRVIDGRGGVATSVRELLLLLGGQVSMEDLVCIELGSDRPSDTQRWARARDRVYKRHRRARSAMVRALAQMADEGTHGRAAVTRATAVVRRLFRARVP